MGLLGFTMSLLVILFIALTFESVFLGAQVQQRIEPYTIHIDTGERECGSLNVGCALMNFFRPILQGIATVVNSIIFIGALATFQVPGAPAWVEATLALSIDTGLILSIVALLRGVS